MSWDYAELSKMAKATGGPDALVDKLVADGVTQGKESMYPVVWLAFAGGVLLWEGGKFLWRKISTWGLPKISEAELMAAREELVQGIKDYDATHPRDDDSNRACEEEE